MSTSFDSARKGTLTSSPPFLTSASPPTNWSADPWEIAPPMSMPSSSSNALLIRKWRHSLLFSPLPDSKPDTTPPTAEGTNPPASARPVPSPVPVPVRSSSEGSIDPWNTTGRRPTASLPINTGYSATINEGEGDGDGDGDGEGGNSAFGGHHPEGAGMGYGEQGWALKSWEKVEVVRSEEKGGNWVMKHVVWIVRRHVSPPELSSACVSPALQF